jgi:hypothetical protein
LLDDVGFSRHVSQALFGFGGHSDDPRRDTAQENGVYFDKPAQRADCSLKNSRMIAGLVDNDRPGNNLA